MSMYDNDLNQMDGATSFAICKDIGERLRLTLPPEASKFPPRLQDLLEELHRRDNEGGKPSN